MALTKRLHAADSRLARNEGNSNALETGKTQ